MIRLPQVRPSLVKLLLLLVAAICPTIHAFPSPVSSISNVAPLSMVIRKSKKGTKKTNTTPTTSRGFGPGSNVSIHGNGNGSMGTKNPPSWASRFPFAGTIRPGARSEQRTFAPNGAIVPPSYAQDGRPKNGRPMLPWVIEVKTPDEIEKMRESGKLARTILDLAGRAVKPGVTTEEIDDLVYHATVEAGAYPSQLNYHGYPKSCCTSVNEVVCHGIPDDRPLQEGDIVNLDITVYLNGFHGDCSEMFYVGDEAAADSTTKQLLQVTYDSWIKACNFVQPGNEYKDIGAIIEDHVMGQGFTTVRSFCGHGIGSIFHSTPDILHYRNNEPHGKMAPGHTFTIEPMICEGSSKTLAWPDNWTYTTVDGKRSAQFEHTLLVTNDGVEALTGKTMDSPLHFWERESQVHNGIWLGNTPDSIASMAEINAKLLPEWS